MASGGSETAVDTHHHWSEHRRHRRFARNPNSRLRFGTQAPLGEVERELAGHHHRLIQVTEIQVAEFQVVEIQVVEILPLAMD